MENNEMEKFLKETISGIIEGTKANDRYEVKYDVGFIRVSFDIGIGMSNSVKNIFIIDSPSNSRVKFTLDIYKK